MKAIGILNNLRTAQIGIDPKNLSEKSRDLFYKFLESMSDNHTSLCCGKCGMYLVGKGTVLHEECKCPSVSTDTTVDKT
jgi:hypothetical protein